ncbi:MAG: hypothetical protein ABH954_02725 [Candidatus Omnitrophota bacterium]
MKKIAILLLPIILIGCVTIEVPEQIREEFPYERTFNAGFEASIDSAAKTLEAMGWKVDNISRSTLLKKDRSFDKTPTRTANIFTQLKQVQMFLTSSYSTFNLRVEAIDQDRTLISVRFLSIVPIPPLYNKKVSYRNDKLVEKLYSRIEEQLNK